MVDFYITNDWLVNLTILAQYCLFVNLTVLAGLYYVNKCGDLKIVGRGKAIVEEKKGRSYS